MRSPALAIALCLTLGAANSAGNPSASGRASLADAYDTAAVETLSPILAHKFARLAAIDPEHPLADPDDTQTLSLFGREDLIAGASGEFRNRRCAKLIPATDPLDEIERRARRTSIVIINESHERSEHRGFIARVATRFRALGYDTFAIETLANAPPGTPERYQPPFVRLPRLPYLEDEDGAYQSEAGFGRLGRQAKALGYRLLGYEPNENTQPDPNTPADQRVATREEGMARNLAAYMASHPGARLLVHVGYSHASERPQANGSRWMALRLKEKTGIDPLTISQTTCRGSGNRVQLSVLPPDQPPGNFDLVVDHPTARFLLGRPQWRLLAGDRPVTIPRALLSRAGWRVVEARPEGEPVTSVPIDRVAIRPGDHVALMLPPGRYRLRVIDVPHSIAGSAT